MARKHAKLLAEIWSSPDWVALEPVEQWAYMALLSQPKLTLCGVLDYMPHRWTKWAVGTSQEAIEDAIRGLERRWFVVVDRGTHELLIRSFVKHDGIAAGNKNLLKGLWGSWEAVESDYLKKVAVDNMPGTVFVGSVPAEAERLRRSPAIERPFPRALTQASEPTSKPTCLLPPATTILHPSPNARSDERSRGGTAGSMLSERALAIGERG